MKSEARLQKKSKGRNKYYFRCYKTGFKDAAFAHYNHTVFSITVTIAINDLVKASIKFKMPAPVAALTDTGGNMTKPFHFRCSKWITIKLLKLKQRISRKTRRTNRKCNQTHRRLQFNICDDHKDKDQKGQWLSSGFIGKKIKTI